MLVLKKNVHKPGHFQSTIHYDGKSFSCPRTQKGFTSYYMHFSTFKICSQIFLSAILHHISLLRLLPKSYFKIRTFHPIFCALAPLNHLAQTMSYKCVDLLVESLAYMVSVGNSLNSNPNLH